MRDNLGLLNEDGKHFTRHRLEFEFDLLVDFNFEWLADLIGKIRATPQIASVHRVKYEDLGLEGYLD
jgi:hypothetical protein